MLEPVSKLIPKRKRAEIVADKEKMGNHPEAQQRCVEDGFSFFDAVWRDFSLLQPEAILR